jgi:hypothetical protein
MRVGERIDWKGRGNQRAWVWEYCADIVDSIKLAPESVSAAETPDAFAAPLDIYPNPAHQAITLQLPSEENDLFICISNLLGQGKRMNTKRQNV